MSCSRVTLVIVWWGLALAACVKDEKPAPSRHGNTVAGALVEAQIESARLQLSQVANEAYPLWAMNHPNQECPATLDPLLDYLHRRKLVDPWGNPLVLHCQDRAPGDDRFGVSSAGPDGQPGTEDDLRSWDEATRRVGRSGAAGVVAPAPLPTP